MLPDGYLWLLVATCAVYAWMIAIFQQNANSPYVGNIRQLYLSKITTHYTSYLNAQRWLLEETCGYLWRCAVTCAVQTFPQDNNLSRNKHFTFCL